MLVVPVLVEELVEVLPVAAGALAEGLLQAASNVKTALRTPPRKILFRISYPIDRTCCVEGYCLDAFNLQQSVLSPRRVANA